MAAGQAAQDDMEAPPELLLRRHLAGVLGGLGEQWMAGDSRAA